MERLFTDVMIDIETLDTTPTSVILSIGAVPFNIGDGQAGQEYSSKCNVSMQVRDGHTIGMETLKWWIEQDAGVLSNSLSGGEWVRRSVENLNDFISEKCVDEVRLWSNSPSFDLVILKNALNNPWPFPFWRERDVRTFVAIRSEIAKEFARKATHDPVDDCLRQIDMVCAVYWDLNGISI
ncbi:3'-5' exonuclease [Sphingobacterium multivorum]|uniref:Exodeoxyribonuclease VIII n=1 Tax=Sphingobacterium multivorum TaxID=28454 RepID=A0A653YSC9_SPHMU|nr:3'-5' exonuclease [Sphingobacterium multivorum]VXC45226.1 Exodeoxyribonuclease VIII [Sphingobacterium multivorum]